MYATPPLVDALLAVAVLMHAADGWGAVFEQDPAFPRAGHAAAVAAARGVVVVRGLDATPEELSALVNHGSACGHLRNRRAGRRFRRAETIHPPGVLVVAVIRACAGDGGRRRRFEKWLAGGESPVTDWHADGLEPPAGSRCLGGGERGPHRDALREHSTDRIDLADRELLAAPPARPRRCRGCRRYGAPRAHAR